MLVFFLQKKKLFVLTSALKIMSDLPQLTKFPGVGHIILKYFHWTQQVSITQKPPDTHIVSSSVFNQITPSKHWTCWGAIVLYQQRVSFFTWSDIIYNNLNVCKIIIHITNVEVKCPQNWVYVLLWSRISHGETRCWVSILKRGTQLCNETGVLNCQLCEMNQPHTMYQNRKHTSLPWK